MTINTCEQHSGGSQPETPATRLIEQGEEVNPVDPGRRASFSQEPGRGQLSGIAARTTKLGPEQATAAHQQRRRSCRHRTHPTRPARSRTVYIHALGMRHASASPLPTLSRPFHLSFFLPSARFRLSEPLSLSIFGLNTQTSSGLP